MTTPTWLVWSVIPPAHLERVCCASVLDAGRAWAERQFRKGILPHSGTEVLVCAENDLEPRQSTYQLKISMVNEPAFRARLIGLAFEGLNGGGDKKRGP